MAMIGHTTESIDRRYSIVDQSMLEMGTSKLDMLQETQRGSRPVVVSMKKQTAPSTLIRQLLNELGDRSGTAIIYDPALEYTPQFYTPERGDVILNPIDAQ
jgi:hypothetical protein